MERSRKEELTGKGLKGDKRGGEAWGTPDGICSYVCASPVMLCANFIEVFGAAPCLQQCDGVAPSLSVQLTRQ